MQRVTCNVGLRRRRSWCRRFASNVQAAAVCWCARSTARFLAISGNPLHPDQSRRGLSQGFWWAATALRSESHQGTDGACRRARQISLHRLGRSAEDGGLPFIGSAEQRICRTLAILGGQYRGYRDTLWSRFAQAYGTPNYIRLRCFAPEKPALAHQLMQGVTTPLAYDLAEAQFILSFGAGLLESWIGPVHTSQAYARLRRSSDRPRGLLVQIDPRRSPTAIKGRPLDSHRPRNRWDLGTRHRQRHDPRRTLRRSIRRAVQLRF